MSNGRQSKRHFLPLGQREERTYTPTTVNSGMAKAKFSHVRKILPLSDPMIQSTRASSLCCRRRQAWRTLPAIFWREMIIYSIRNNHRNKTARAEVRKMIGIRDPIIGPERDRLEGTISPKSLPHFYDLILSDRPA